MYCTEGRLPKLEFKKIIGIVGSRKANQRELNIAYNIARDLASRGNLIVSGLARGVDTYAHRGAIETGYTVSILSTCPTERIFPPENLALSKNIKKRGLLVYPYSTPSNRSYTKDLHNHFQKRLIERSILTAYIVDSIIVISDNEKIMGGTRWACNYALKLDKPVVQIFSDGTRKKNKDIKMTSTDLYWVPEIDFEVMAKNITDEIRGYKK